MQKKIAQFISIVLHPLLMPAFGFFIIFNSGAYLNYFPLELKKIIYIIVIINTFVLPLSFIQFFVYQKVINNIQLDSNRQRVIPLIITTLLYYFSYYLLGKLQSPQIIQLFMLASTILVFLTFLISLKWKISAHMVGIGGLIGMIMALSFRLMINLQAYLMISIFVAGLLGYARLRLNAHGPIQVYSGLGIGVILVLLIIIKI